MASELITCTINDGLCTIALNRPDKLNALQFETIKQLGENLDRIEFEEVGCVLLTGNGRSFCAGLDLDDLAAGNKRGDVKEFESNIVERLANLPVPVVAAVRGHCYTGGLELVLSADIILATDTARFADTHAKWDLVPIWGMTQRLPRRIGRQKATEMMFSSRTYSGVEAAAMGLANYSFPEDTFDAEVRRMCDDILGNSRRSIRAIKKLLLDTEGMRLGEGIAWESHRGEGHGPDFEARLAAMR